MLPRWILHVETNLGLRPSGVERLGEVLLKLGLAERLGARTVDGLRAPAFRDRPRPRRHRRLGGWATARAIRGMRGLRAPRPRPPVRRGEPGGVSRGYAR